MMSTTDFDTRTITENLRATFGKFPQVRAALTRLTTLLSDEVTLAEPVHLMLLGESGTGKSTLLRYFLRQHPPVEHPEFTEVPVLYAEIPSKTTVRALAGLLLRNMGSEFWDKGDEVARTFQLTTLLKACKTRLIVLDEVNHLVDRGGVKTHYHVADWIKQLGQPGGPAVVLAGTPRAQVLLETNLQLRTRFGELLWLKPFSTLPHGIAEFAAALKAFSKLLKELPCIDLSTPSTVEKFGFATGGRLRLIRSLLVRAVELAGSAAPPRIDLPTLAIAFEQVVFPGASPERNPFRAEFSGIPLTKASEPFAPEFTAHASRK